MWQHIAEFATEIVTYIRSGSLPFKDQKADGKIKRIANISNHVIYDD